VAVESVSADPGYGFVTLRPHPKGEPPDLVIVPLGSIRRFDVSKAREEEPPLGFTLPAS
jgi:hypothetical protein